jgi:hypothetical protein
MSTEAGIVCEFCGSTKEVDQDVNERFVCNPCFWGDDSEYRKKHNVPRHRPLQDSPKVEEKPVEVLEEDEMEIGGFL